MGMFRSARDYMKSYRRTNPVPRSLLQDLGIDEKVHLCLNFSKTPIMLNMFQQTIMMDDNDNQGLDEDVEDEAE